MLQEFGQYSVGMLCLFITHLLESLKLKPFLRFREEHQYIALEDED
jgi:hypothetical protein